MKSFLKNILFIFNLLVLKFSNVKCGKDVRIKGFFFITNKGRIIIGNNFRANSGKRYNPIGGDTILRFICNENATIQIGDNCGISNSTFVSHNSIIVGNFVLIGGGCKIWDTDFHSINPNERILVPDSNVRTKPIVIKDFAFIGGGSIILKGVIIGQASVIAAGSVVTKSIPDYEVWGGNPARFLKKVEL